MKTFKLYKHPTQDIVVIKEGFSWSAFFFGPIWMLLNELWWLACLWVGLLAVCPLIKEVAFQPPVGGIQILAFFVLFVATFGLSFLSGFKGNEWLEEKVSKRGFELLNTVQAESPLAAISQC